MDDREAILREVDRFITAYKHSDLVGVMDCYTDDIVKLRSGAPTETRQQLHERLAEFFRKWRGEVTVDNQEILVSADLAVIRGSLEITLDPLAGGQPQSLKRRFLEVWRKQQGRWRVARTMDNTDQ
jgi:uncharacterized protein (TIGR02246 family)